VLADEDQGIGEHIESYSQAAPLGSHHELEPLKIVTPLHNRGLGWRHLSCFQTGLFCG
jgi:hypothetical protein